MANENTDTFEETLVRDIEILKDKIERGGRDLEENKKFLSAFETALKGRRRNIFYQKYGVNVEQVTRDYLKLLYDHSQPSTGYRVLCPDYGLDEGPELMLIPEHREKCLPTQMVIDAYAFFGKTVSIAEELSYE
jgi:hypothetical protein